MYSMFFLLATLAAWLWGWQCFSVSQLVDSPLWPRVKCLKCLVDCPEILDGWILFIPSTVNNHINKSTKTKHNKHKSSLIHPKTKCFGLTTKINATVFINLFEL